MGNKALKAASKVKNDEFYTQIADIERECYHYKNHFKGKIVFCNCDDPRVSRFFYFFYSRFYDLGLKRLIATCCKNLNPDSQNLDEQSVYYDGADRADRDYDTFINEWGVLKGDGDFRSSECIELLKQADIVCTNPPFSLFREYVAQLMEYDKKFLLVGSLNAITYKEIFPLMKGNRLWLGYGFLGGNAFFKTTVNREFADGVYNSETGLVKFRNVHWFTNLDHTKRHEDLQLWKKYTSEEFPKYDNYDAIEVSKVIEIPIDYDGVMGVPITFLDKYNPEQFEIIGLTGVDVALEKGRPYINGKRMYARILIKRKKRTVS